MLPLLLLFLFLAFCLPLVLVDVALVLVAALVTIAEYYVCSVSDRVMCSVLAICRCIAPCARCQDLFNPKKHTRVQMPRDEFSKMWRGHSLEARKKARKKKRKFPIFSKLGWIGMCFCFVAIIVLMSLLSQK